MAKYVFVTGGVTSSLGKGIIAASLAKLLQARGFTTTIQKFDPYINVNHVVVVMLKVRGKVYETKKKFSFWLTKRSVWII